MKSTQTPVACQFSPFELTDKILWENRIYLWSGRLSPGTTPEIVADLAGFSPGERCRLASLSRVEHRAGYAAAHGALRFALSTLLGRKPGELKFVHTAAGAPELADHSFPRFSISHCEELAAIALADRRVGVDIERVIWCDDLLDVADQFLSPTIRQEIVACEQSRRADVFAQYWTLTEAFAKATGCGLAEAPLVTFSSGDRPQIKSFNPIFGSPSDWQVGLF